MENEVAKEIKRLSDVVIARQAELDEASNALGDFVKGYMKENDLWENIEAIKDMICRLPPAAYLRFILFGKYYELTEDQKHQEEGEPSENPVISEQKHEETRSDSPSLCQY